MSLSHNIDTLDGKIDECYKSKAKQHCKLPIVVFVENTNKEKEDGWLSTLVQARSIEYSSLLSFFFIGAGMMGNFLKAIGNNDNKVPGLQLFKEKLSYVTIQVDNQNDFKERLLAAIESACSFEVNSDKTAHPVINLLSEMNDQLGRGDWLFKVKTHKKTKQDRSKIDGFLAIAMYHIIGCGSTSKYLEVLTKSLGCSANDHRRRKQFINNIARAVLEETKQGGNDATVQTVATGPTVALTEASTVLATVPLNPIRKNPPSIVTAIDSSSSSSKMMIMSPLTDRSSTASKF